MALHVSMQFDGVTSSCATASTGATGSVTNTGTGTATEEEEDEEAAEQG